MRTITRAFYVCFATILVVGAVFVTGCTPEPVTTTLTNTTTATTTATETVTTTETVTRTSTLLPEPTIPFQIAEGITVIEANAMIQANMDNPDFVLIDVRTPEERAVSYIGENSIHVDWNAGTFEAEVESWDRCKTYLLY